MIVDELILKLQADLGDIKKSLKQVEADAAKAGKDAGSKMGKEAGTSFGDVFNAIAGAAVLNTVKGFFSKAAAEFNKMEAAMMRVDSIAKGFGRSVEVAKKQVNELADKGFLNLNQAASSYADAIALGFDEKQARKFIDSLSDIAAFQNTIGNGAEAVQSGLAGLLSNSAEKVENIGVPVKVLNQEYQKNIQTMGKAAALQKFYNGILKESDKFQGDAAKSVDTLAGAQNKYNAAVDKAQVAIGQGLEPLLKKFYAFMQQIALGFANWFGGLDSTTKALALMAPLVGGVVIALGTMLPILKALSLSNPFGWVAIAVTALVALSAALNEVATVNVRRVVQSYKDSASALKEQGDRVKELEAINKRTASQEKELIDIKEKLRQRAKALGLDYDQLAKSAGNAANMTAELTAREREREANKLRVELKNVMDDRAAFEARFELMKRLGSSETLIGLGLGSFGGVSGVRSASDKRRAELVQGIADIYQPDQNISKKDQAALANSGATEQRFLDAQNKLKEIEKNLVFTISQAKNVKDKEERERRINAAIEDAKMQAEAELSTRRQAYAEFIEDKYMADTEALKKSTDDAIRASNELLEAGIKKAKGDEWEIAALKEDNEERLQKIREGNARKQAAIALQSFADTANAANATMTGVAGLARARDLGGAFTGLGGIAGGLSGLKGLFPALGALGPAGQAIGAVGGIVSTLTGLFGKSDEERAREAEQQKARDEARLKMLELQANYQKSMLALQEQQAKLPFENLQRQLRLIDISAQQQRVAGGNESTIETQRLVSRRTAIGAVLSSESGSIGKGQLFGGQGSSASDITTFLNERAAQSIASQQFLQLFEVLASANPHDTNFVGSVLSQLESYRGKIPPEMFANFESYKAEFTRINTLDQNRMLSGPFAQSMGNGETAMDIFQMRSRLGGTSQGLLSGVRSLGSEITADTGIAENLLSVIEQSNALELEIAGNTKKTAENTSKALELRPDRERSFIDVGRGYIQSLGQRITSPSGMALAAQLSQQGFSVPSEIGSASVTSSRARTLQERMADALEMQLAQGATANDILRDIRALTYDLLSVMDGDASTGASFSQQDFINFSADVKRRRI